MPDRDTFLEEIADQFDKLMEKLEDIETEEPDFKELRQIIEQLVDEVETLQG